MARDLTARQFERALARHNFERQPYSMFGYVHDNVTGYNICALNAGGNHRDQLAYLIAERKRWAAKARA